MTHSVHGTYSRDQVMMTLSAIAYTSLDSLATLQEGLDAAEALQQEYTAVWMAKDDSNLIYLVKNRLHDSYAIAIRGSVFQFDLALLFKLYEDLGLARQVSFPNDETGGAKISAGILDTVLTINNLIYKGNTLSQLLNKLPEGTLVHITGHSLGGTLAATYALHLSNNNAAGLDIIPYTFGAPNAGNNLFADLFNPESKHFRFSQSSRVVNNRDIIPFAWNDLQGIPAIDYGDSKCPIDLTLCLDCMARMLIVAQVFYVQPPVSHFLRGKIEPIEGFFQQAMHQHQHNSYLKLLGLRAITSADYSYRRKKVVALSASL